MPCSLKRGYIEVRITAKADTLEAAHEVLNPWDTIYSRTIRLSVGRDLTVSMEETLGHVLLEEQSTISTAESCTSGLVGKLLTNVSG